MFFHSPLMAICGSGAGKNEITFGQVLSFIKYPDFRAAYEVLKRHTAAFTNFTETAVGEALRENSRVLGILRAILGMTPPEWAELARTDGMSDITQGAARGLDRSCRETPEYVSII